MKHRRRKTEDCSSENIEDKSYVTHDSNTNNEPTETERKQGTKYKQTDQTTGHTWMRHEWLERAGWSTEGTGLMRKDGDENPTLQEAKQH